MVDDGESGRAIFGCLRVVAGRHVEQVVEKAGSLCPSIKAQRSSDWRLRKPLWIDQKKDCLLQFDSGSGAVPVFGMDVFLYTKRIRECTKTGNMAGAVHLFESMKENGVRPDVVTYSTMMDGFSKAGDPESVHRLFDEIKSRGKPNTYIFNIAIGACSINVDLKRAAHLFSSMQRQHGLKPNAWTYGSLLHLCSVAGQLPLAKKCFDKLEKEAIRKDVVAYSSLIDAYAEATVPSTGSLHMNECLSLIDKMKLEGIQPDDRTYAALVKLCTKARLTKEAFKLVERMQREGIHPHVYIYNMLLDLLTKDGSISNEEAASRMKLILTEMETRKVELHLETFNVLFTLCCKLGDLKLADDFLARLRKSGLKPDNYSYSALIKCHEHIGDPSDKEAYLKTCFDLAEEMKAAGYPLTVGIHIALITACTRVKDADRAYGIWNEANKKGIGGDLGICRAMINAFLQSNELERAEGFLRQMESHGGIRNSVICEMFLKHYALKQKKRKAKHYLKDMKDLRIKQSESVSRIVAELGLS